jgi:hypothetical protein
MLHQMKWICFFGVLLAATPGFAQREGSSGGGRGMGFIGGVAGGRPGGSPLLLLNSPAVQEELALTPDQKKQTESLVNQMREAMRSESTDFQALRELSDEQRRAKFEEMGKQRTEQMAKFKPKFAEILDDVQMRRLQEISWQAQGTGALRDPELVQALGLSQEQQDKISTINRQFQEQFASGRSRRPEGDRGGAGDGNRAANNPTADRTSGNGRGNFEAFREAMAKRDAEVTSVLTEEQQGKFKELKGAEFDVSKLRTGPPGNFGRSGGRGGDASEGNRPRGNKPESSERSSGN